MSAKTPLVPLTKLEITVLLEALHAHLAGDVSVGDLSWTYAKETAALVAVRKLQEVLDNA